MLFKLKIHIILLTVLSFFAIIKVSEVSAQSSGQTCLVNINASQLVQGQGYCGIPLNFEAQLDTFTVALGNDFNTGTLGAGWLATSGYQFNNPCGTSPSGASGDQYLWMGAGVPIPRTITTVGFDVSCGGSICFDFKNSIQGQPNPCEGPDLPNEGITLQYSANGGTWTNIIYMHPNGTFSNANPQTLNPSINGQTPFTAWGTYCFDIPVAARSCNTSFRWIQEAYSSQQNDHWGLDNVQILANICGPFTFSWWGPGTPSGNVNSFTHAYTSNVTIAVTVTNNPPTNIPCVNPVFCTDTITIPIRPLEVEILASPEAICKGESTTLSAYSGASMSSQTSYYEWLWNPTGDTTQIITVSPEQTMSYTGRVRVKDFPNQCSAEDDILITVSQPKPSLISIINHEICPDAEDGAAWAQEQFIDGFEPFVYTWLTNPNQISQTASGIAPGTYFLSTVDSLNCEQIDSFKINEAIPFDFSFVRKGDTCLNGNLYWFDPVREFSDSLLQFPLLIDSILQADNYNFNWNFGDNQLNYFGDSVTYHYTSADTFWVTMIATSQNSCVDTFKQKLRVFAQPEMGFTFENACKQDAVLFTDTSYVENNDTLDYIIKSNWYYGDNTSSEGKVTSHYYETEGKYNTLLVVETFLGCVDSIWHEVETYPLPIANFLTQNTCASQNAVFENISFIPPNDELKHIYWHFGDGNTLDNQSVDENPKHVFDSAGTYGVYMVVSTARFCKDSVYKEVDINANPIVNFSISDSAGCEPHTVSFHNLSSVENGTIKQSVWQLEDFQTEENSFSYTYENEGKYQVSLNVISDKGCQGSLSINDLITVYPKPNADFNSASNNSQFISNPYFEFENLSTDADLYAWNMGDGNATNLTSTNVNYTFNNVGAYPVTLIAGNNFNCWDTITKIVSVESEFSLHIPNAFTPNGDSKNDVFYVYGEGIMNIEIMIFDRWGKLVFFSDNIDNGWDGKNGEDIRKEGTYVYRINAFDKFGKSHEFMGEINLIR